MGPRPENIKKSQSLLEFKDQIKRCKPEGARAGCVKIILLMEGGGGGGCTCRLCKDYIVNLGFSYVFGHYSYLLFNKYF